MAFHKVDIKSTIKVKPIYDFQINKKNYIFNNIECNVSVIGGVSYPCLGSRFPLFNIFMFSN